MNNITIHIETISDIDMGAIGICYPIGSASVGLAKGCAHFLEHLVCHSLSSQGVGGAKGRTGRDNTYYWLLIPKKRLQETIETVLKMNNLLLENNAIEQERAIILRELAQKQLNRSNIALERLQTEIFYGHGYGLPIIGEEKDINSIQLKDLKKGLFFYQIPTQISIIGSLSPKEIEVMISKIRERFSECSIPPTSSSVPWPVQRCRGFRTLQNNDRGPEHFTGGAWPLPGRLNGSVVGLQLLQIVWRHRIIKEFIGKRISLRLNVYEKAGILTLDSVEPSVYIDDIKRLIQLFHRPVEQDEYKEAALSLYLHNTRQKEDLNLRIQQKMSEEMNSKTISLEELRIIQQRLSNILIPEEGMYISTRKEKEQMEIVPYPFNGESKKERTERNNIPYIKEIVDSNNFIASKYESQKHPSKKVSLIREGERYFTVSISPLTNRIHVIYRIDCTGVGRLLIPRDILSFSYKGSFEGIRYEGWHTIAHFAFFRIEDAQRSIREWFRRDFSLSTIEYSTIEAHISKTIEHEIKWRILQAIHPVSIPFSVPVIRGFSIVIPHSIEFSTHDFKKLLKENPLEKNNGSIVVKETSIPSRFDGAGVICKIPRNFVSALALQEAAYNNEAPFRSLLSIVREKGISYHIVQSLCQVGNDLYIYWACQCSQKFREIFYLTVRFWLEELYEQAEEVEKWFLSFWLSNNPNNHRSVHQLLRDIDRSGHYAGTLSLTTLNFRQLISDILSTSFTTVKFVKQP